MKVELPENFVNGSTRFLVVGYPRSGKSSFARAIGRALRVEPIATDQVMGLGWSEASEAASNWFDRKGPLVIEGVAGLRALRKWLLRNSRMRTPQPMPIDRLIFLRRQLDPDSMKRGLVSMSYGIDTTFKKMQHLLGDMPVEHYTMVLD